jgi:8-oxo-dGTP pyrophosphatase MutT (NUDIX family)
VKAKNLRISVKAIILRNGKILLLKPTNPRGSIGGWDGPGGHIMPGESPLEALKREVFEETGLKVQNPLPIKIFVPPSGKTFYLIFLCTVPPGKIVLSKEHKAFKWVNLAEFKKITGFNLIKELEEINKFCNQVLKKLKQKDLLETEE